MPHPIPMEQVIDAVVVYLTKRLMQGRPTTLRQMSKRIGLGVPTIKGILERHSVQYILIPHGERDWITSSIEIAVRSMPASLAERNGFSVEQIEAAYQKYFGEYELEPVDDWYKGMTPEEIALEVDPYFPYRISYDTFAALKPQLISHAKLIQEARKRGYNGRAVDRATGGNRMRYKLPSELWRPYVYRNKRYYLKEVLNYLNESYGTYKRESTAKAKLSARTGEEVKKDDHKTKRRAATRTAKSNPGNRRGERNSPAKDSVLNG